MSAETTTKPYTSHTVWDDESGERVFIEGHVQPDRRAIAVANRWARVECGLVNLFDDRDDAANWPEWITVRRGWFRPDPQWEGDDESATWCDADHPQAEPVTVVTW